MNLFHSLSPEKSKLVEGNNEKKDFANALELSKWRNKQGKGTGSFGNKRNNTHTLCVRCGCRSFHLQNVLLVLTLLVALGNINGVLRLSGEGTHCLIGIYSIKVQMYQLKASFKGLNLW